jgi:VanZ family protein
MNGIRNGIRNIVRGLGRRAIVLPILCMAFIFGLSSIPGGSHDVLGYTLDLSPRIGNFLHLPVYYVLGALWLVALEARGVPGARAAVLACFLGTAFGALDEVHQYFVPLRSMDIRDVIANFAGCLAAALTWPWTRAIFFAREEHRGQPVARPGAAE